MEKTSLARGLLCVPLIAGGLFMSAYCAPAPRKAAPVRISPLADSLRKPVRVPAPAVRAALRDFTRRTGPWRVRFSPRTALPESLSGAKTRAYPGTPVEAALAFINDNKGLLQVDAAQLRLAYSRTALGVTHIQFDQVSDSVPVEFAYVRVHVGPGGEITGFQSKFEPDAPAPEPPALPLRAAENAALADLGGPAALGAGKLVLFPDPAAGGALKPAWKIRARPAGETPGVWIYYISADDGRVLFKYDDLRYAAAGTVTGLVYPVSPVPAGASNIPSGSWTSPVSKAISNQFVWITNSLTSPTAAVTDANGSYYSSADGKVFASLKGPYFSVVNFRGPSAHFDNGGGQWRTYTHSPVTGSPPSADNTYSITVPDDWSGNSWAFAKAMPRFASFNAGSMNIYGDISDPSEVNVLIGTRPVASYIGRRTAPFLGASVETPSYGLALAAPPGGVPSGSFSVDISSYLVLTDSPLVTSNPTGAISWQPGGTGVRLEPFPGNSENNHAEVNVFYHLNSAYNYFALVNKDPADPGRTPADLTGQVPVMVHAHGLADSIAGSYGMRNAFYDLEMGNIFIGDGYVDGYSNFRSFALDGTIVRHEYVHHVIDRIYPIINIGEFGALSEALADYFSLASLQKEGNDISELGNFIDASMPGSSRSLLGSSRMPDSWNGEVHDDSLILSQPLWTLRKDADPAKNLGSFTSGVFAGMHRTDVLVYAALFYLPDNFANFYDAMLESCSRLEQISGSGDCSSTERAKITTAFAGHGIPAYSGGGDQYDQPAAGTMCDNNNGPECATDLSALASLSATIYPVADADFYSIPLAAGQFSATLALPASGEEYQAYTLTLFDSARNFVAEVSPLASNTWNGICPASGECVTNSPNITFSRAVAAGRYYLVVSAAGNYSAAPYTLTLNASAAGSAQARVVQAVFDRDVINFSARVENWSVTESTFAYAQLRDGKCSGTGVCGADSKPLSFTRTGSAGSYLALSGVPALRTGADGLSYLDGTVNILPGFASRYPGVGSVYLEIFGQNRMGTVFSLGVSGELKLAAGKSDIVAYNNVLTGSNTQARIRYDVQSEGELTINIYTVTGVLVKTVFEGHVTPGKGTLSWDGTNAGGSKVASGVYYLKAKGAGLDKVDKIAVIR